MIDKQRADGAGDHDAESPPQERLASVDEAPEGLLSSRRRSGLLDGDRSYHRQHAWLYEDLLT